jgi:hypothetical protein
MALLAWMASRAGTSSMDLARRPFSRSCTKNFTLVAIGRCRSNASTFPKPDGRERPLGVPTVKDRIVQTAVLLVLKPIFEVDFVDSSYGRFGRARNAAPWNTSTGC